MTGMVARMTTFHGFVAVRTAMFHLFLGAAFSALTGFRIRHHLRADRSHCSRLGSVCDHRLGRFRPRGRHRVRHLGKGWS
jgi:hypothetical protein